MFKRCQPHRTLAGGVSAVSSGAAAGWKGHRAAVELPQMQRPSPSQSWCCYAWTAPSACPICMHTAVSGLGTAEAGAQPPILLARCKSRRATQCAVFGG
jgi:hypothetical protein